MHNNIELTQHYRTLHLEMVRWHTLCYIYFTTIKNRWLIVLALRIALRKITEQEEINVACWESLSLAPKGVQALLSPLLLPLSSPSLWLPVGYADMAVRRPQISPDIVMWDLSLPPSAYLWNDGVGPGELPGVFLPDLWVKVSANKSSEEEWRVKKEEGRGKGDDLAMTVSVDYNFESLWGHS